MKRLHNLHIGCISRCPVNCIFCCLDYEDAIGWDHKEYIPKTIEELCELLDDIIKRDPDVNAVGLTAGPCDAFGAPHIYDVLELLLKKYPTITFKIVTTGSLAKIEKLKKLKPFQNIGFDLSVQTFNSEIRKQIMGVYDIEPVKYILKNFKTLAYISDTGDTNILLNDIGQIPIYNKSAHILFRRIDYTKYSTKEGIEFSKRSIVNFENSVSLLQKMKINPLYYLVEPEFAFKYNIKQYKDRLMRLIAHVRFYLLCIPRGKVLFLSSKSMFQIWKQHLNDIPNVTIDYIENTFYGGSINTGALLVKSDIEFALQKFNPNEYNIILVPAAIVDQDALIDQHRLQDHRGNDLSDLKTKYGTKLEYFGIGMGDMMIIDESDMRSLGY